MQNNDDVHHRDTEHTKRDESSQIHKFLHGWPNTVASTPTRVKRFDALEKHKNVPSPTQQFTSYDSYYVRRSQIFPRKTKTGWRSWSSSRYMEQSSRHVRYNVMFCTRSKLHRNFSQVRKNAESTNRTCKVIFVKKNYYMMMIRLNLKIRDFFSQDFPNILVYSI